MIRAASERALGNRVEHRSHEEIHGCDVRRS